jgi:site-specific recombinase XerC
MAFLKHEEPCNGDVIDRNTHHPAAPADARRYGDALDARADPENYIRHVRAFAAFLGRPPDTATAEDVRRFQVHQREHGISESVIGATVSALRFLFGVTLGRPDLSRKPVLAPRARKLPDVLSVGEVARLLETAPGIKYRAALGVAYGACLRVSEVAHLQGPKHRQQARAHPHRGGQGS